MTLTQVNLSDTQQFSSLFLDYLEEKPALKDWYHRPPRLESFREQIEEKQMDASQRVLLTEALQKQYSQVKTPEVVTENIKSLQDSRTFTVTTGHQLNIFTGPLYFIYKLITTLNLCKKLSEAYPGYRFVPVYWMASEDHDFEEINHFLLFGKKYVWQTSQQGAVGRFQTDGIREVLESLPEPVPVFEQAYRSCETLAAATRYYVNALFGKAGLVVLDADDAALKASFREVMKDDLLAHTAKQRADEATEKIEQAGYKTQVFPREINLFYLKESLRERMVLEDGQYQVNNTDITFSKEALLEELEQHPENFSPNVILRPLYQEWVLPNLAYVGGPAEVAYWLQLKPMFDHYQTTFPILIPRNFALIINKINQKKLQKTPVDAADLFLDTQTLVKKFVEEHADSTLTLEAEKESLQKVYEAVREKALAVDKSLEGFIGAETNKALKSLSNIEKRLKKAEENNQETTVKQLESIKNKLFPEGILQERKENFLNFYINNPKFIDELLTHLDPLDFRFHVLYESA